MVGSNKEIGIFEAIYSLMEHEHRIRGAELSGQRMRALQAGNAELFNQTTAQIGQTDAKLLFILQKRGAQAAEFEEKGIEQPGLSMAEKLHEYMLTLSGGTLPRTPTSLPEGSIAANPPVVISAPVPAPETSNGHVPIKPPVIRTEIAPPPAMAIKLPPVVEGAPSDPPAPEPFRPVKAAHPLAEFKTLVPEEPNWNIPSRPLTQKLESGRYPFGIRQARLALASVKYGVDLERLNSKKSRAVQEAYSDGDTYAPVAKAAADSAINAFVGDFIVRKGKKLMDLPRETQDTIKRIKEDPILGPLTRSANGRARLLEYALYKNSLGQILLGDSYTPDVEDESPRVDFPKKERKTGEPKMPELAPQQLRTVQTYLKIYIQKGWPSDMRRAVALDQYQDDIPRAASVSDIAREEVITNKMGSVARERVRAEKKLVEAAALMEQGAKPSVTIQAVEAETARMLGVDKVTLAEVLDLLNKKVTPDQIRHKAVRPNSDTRQPAGSPAATENGQGAAQIPAGNEASAGAEALRNPEDLQVAEEAAFYSLLALNESGLAFETVEEACASAYREELEAITDPQSRMVRFELLLKQFTSVFNRAINRIESGRSKGTQEHQPHLSLAMDWLNNQEIDGKKIYETRESSTLRRIGTREVDLGQYMRKDRSSRTDRNSREFYTGNQR